MAVNLQKGGNVNLSKEAPGLKKAMIGLAWDKRLTDGEQFDLDAVAFLVGADGKVLSEADFIFYKQPNSTDGSIRHHGDNRTGEGSGDDEKIEVNLDAVPAHIEKIVLGVSIFEFDTRRQNFGQVSAASIRVIDGDTQVDVARYDLTEDYSTETALIFGELYRHNGDWKFRAVGQGFAGGLAAMATAYGVTIG